MRKASKPKIIRCNSVTPKEAPLRRTLIQHLLLCYFRKIRGKDKSIMLTLSLKVLKTKKKLIRSLRSLVRFFDASQLSNKNRACALVMEQSLFMAGNQVQNALLYLIFVCSWNLISVHAPRHYAVLLHHLGSNGVFNKRFLSYICTRPNANNINWSKRVWKNLNDMRRSARLLVRTFTVR